jgi:hypothetical protein
MAQLDHGRDYQTSLRETFLVTWLVALKRQNGKLRKVK